jgi:hypothetical protein
MTNDEEKYAKKIKQTVESNRREFWDRVGEFLN